MFDCHLPQVTLRKSKRKWNRDTGAPIEGRDKSTADGVRFSKKLTQEKERSCYRANNWQSLLHVVTQLIID